MEYSVSLDSVFCFCCHHFSSNVARSYADKLFTKVGAWNWKILSEELTKHASSQVYLNNMKMWESYKQQCTSGSVAAQLSHSHQSIVEKNRQYLYKSVNIVKLLAKLGLPFRGHREDTDLETRGNYLSICNFFSKYDSDFASMHSKYFNFTS